MPLTPPLPTNPPPGTQSRVPQPLGGSRGAVAPQSSGTALTLDELGRLLAATRGSVRDRAVFLLSYRHGLRASELGLRRAEDLDFRTLRLMVHEL